MIPNQHLCKQCLTRYAQELDGLHLQSFPLWKAWWLGVYGVSPNIVVCGRLASKTDKGDVVTLKQEDSEGSLTVVLQKTIRIKFHTFFLSPIHFCAWEFPKESVCLCKSFIYISRSFWLQNWFQTSSCVMSVSHHNVWKHKLSHLLWVIRKLGGGGAQKESWGWCFWA